MRVLKSILAGLVALVIGLCLLLGVVAGAALTSEWDAGYGEGSGGMGAVSIGVSESVVVLVAVLSFAAAFWWRFKKG